LEKLFVIIFIDSHVPRLYYLVTHHFSGQFSYPVGVKSCPSSFIHSVYSFLTLSYNGLFSTTCVLPYTLWGAVASSSWFSY
jgi:hypothetical protein